MEGVGQPCTSCTRSAAVCFWYSPGQGGGDPICPEVAITGLQSAVDRFDVVELLHYQPFVRDLFVQKIPSLVMVDASEYLSEAQFKELFDRGVGIRTLADVVRAKRLLRRGVGWGLLTAIAIGCDASAPSIFGRPSLAMCLAPWRRARTREGGPRRIS